MTTWILLRGLTRESRHWGGFPQHFAAALGDIRVHAPDLPGNGRLNDLNSASTVDAMCDDLRERLRAQGMTPPYHLLALSLGAMVAVAWAVRHPEEIGACVLINTSLRAGNPFWQRLRPAAWATLLRLAWPGTGDDSRERLILALTSRQHPTPDAIVRRWLDYGRERPVALRNALRQLLAAARYRGPAAPPAVPLLVLASRHDALVDPRCSRQIARAWNAAFAEHPEAGHDLPLDDGAWVAEQVRGWPAAFPQR